MSPDRYDRIRRALIDAGVDTELASRAAELVAEHQSDRDLVRRLFTAEDTAPALFTRKGTD